MKNLFVLRHAQAVWPDLGQTDFQRKITEKGKQSVSTAAQFLMQLPSLPEIILTSNAQRALETTETLSSLLSSPIETQEHASLYLAPADVLMKSIQEIPESFASALIVGHNPGPEEFCYLLSDGSFANPIHLGTAKLVQLNLDVDSWKDTCPTSAKIEILIRA